MRVRLFIDFWNFSLAWKKRTSERCDWRKVPAELCKAAGDTLSAAGLGTLELEETRVYASYEPVRESKLRGWLHSFLDKQPGIRVFDTERRWRERPVHCRACDTEHAKCPNCKAPLGRAAEKAVDARIVTDMMNLAWEDAYDVALLLSSDGDFIPAVECLQAKNFKVINATWSGHGHELAKKCWVSFELDPLISRLVRPGPPL